MTKALALGLKPGFLRLQHAVFPRNRREPVIRCSHPLGAPRVEKQTFGDCSIARQINRKYKRLGCILVWSSQSCYHIFEMEILEEWDLKWCQIEVQSGAGGSHIFMLPEQS